MRRTALVLLTMITLALAAACDGGEDALDATVTRSGATAAASVTAAPSTGTPSVTEDASPGAPSATAATPYSGRPPPFNTSTPGPVPTSNIGADGVPRVPALKALTYSTGDRLSDADLIQRLMGPAGRGQLNVARVQIPAIGVDASVEPQIVGTDGMMPDPTAADVVAWYDFSAFQGIGGLPLSGGNAVFAGDFDRVRVGPGVFFRLAEVQPGTIITLELNDGRRLYYRVEFNKVAARDIDFANITFATDDESATFITAAGAVAPDGYPDRRIVWARRVNCAPGNAAGGVSCEVPA